MALSSKSLLVYNIEVTPLNASLDFKAASGGSQLSGTLTLGFYSPTSLADEIARVLNATDPDNIYTVTVNRTVVGGTQNRLTITTNGPYLSLLFASGSRTDTTVATLSGFNITDYTGATSYTGSQSAGTSLMPDYLGYNYLDDFNQAKVFGAVNVSASGLKEAIVFNIQKFINIQFMYEPKSKLAEWKALWYWLIQQRPFDFTPEIANPTTFFQVTLEKTKMDSKGLGFMMIEMLPSFPNHYDTGLMTFRIIDPTTNFI